MPDSRHSVVGEGTDVGIIGGLAVALWFLLLDTIAGHPFLTRACWDRWCSSGTTRRTPRTWCSGPS